MPRYQHPMNQYSTWNENNQRQQGRYAMGGAGGHRPHPPQEQMQNPYGGMAPMPYNPMPPCVGMAPMPYNPMPPCVGMAPMPYNPMPPGVAPGGCGVPNPNNMYAPPVRNTGYNASSPHSFPSRKTNAEFQRKSSALFHSQGSQRGSFRCDNGRSSSFYKTDSFNGNRNMGPYGSFHSNTSAYFQGPVGYGRTNSFQRSGSILGFGSGYGGSFAVENNPSKTSSNAELHRVNSGFHLQNSFLTNASGISYNNGVDGIRDSSGRDFSTSSTSKDDNNNYNRDGVDGGGLSRHNSMTLTRMNSTLNMFYSFGPVMAKQQAEELQQQQGMGGSSESLTESRLSKRPLAPPQWPNGMSPSSTPQPGMKQNGNNQNNNNTTSFNASNSGELTRKGSEKRIGMYFKDVQPTQDSEYKKEVDPDRSRNTRNTNPSMTTAVRKVLLLDRNGGKNAEVDGCTAILGKPNSDEMQKFDTNEIVNFSYDDTTAFIETLDELRDVFVLGCNVGLLMADANCPAHLPSKWFSWNILKRLVKDVFAKMKPRSELSISVCLLEDDQVTDLVAERPCAVSLCVAQSPLFGNVVRGVIYQIVEDAEEFSDLLDLALSKATGREGDERGIIVASAILKQIRKHTPHTKGDEEDIILSSLFASSVGNGIIHYTRILDKNPAEPRAMFQFALGGPAMTAAVISASDEPSNAATTYQFLTTLDRLGAIQNYNLRLGSVRRFIHYARETIPKTKLRLSEMKDGREKVSTEHSLGRLMLMVSDAEAMLESPETAAPKTYVRR